MNDIGYIIIIVGELSNYAGPYVVVSEYLQYRLDRSGKYQVDAVSVLTFHCRSSWLPVDVCSVIRRC